MFTWLILFWALAFGMCIGSFLNVCIYRLPASKSINDPPRSMCPVCGCMINFYDNIPLVSWLNLRGKCRHCHGAIHLRYPAVELISGFLGVSTFLFFGATMEGLVFFTFCATLLVVTFIDIDHRIIPDIITIPGVGLFFILAILFTPLSWKAALLGVVSGGGSLFIVAWTYQRITGKEGMGGGDIKLLSMIGALLGWKGVCFTLFFSSAAGTLVGIVLMTRSKKGIKLAIPFGPFLSLGGIVYIFFGPQLIHWYLTLAK
jgi:leader peptidase (prepilin peptidase) / N-methyltransferase